MVRDTDDASGTHSYGTHVFSWCPIILPVGNPNRWQFEVEISG